MSLGWPVFGKKAYNPGKTVRDAVAYAYNKGVTIVCASGNDGKRAVAYPAAYDAYCIAVGATRYNETRASYSNYGSALDIMAPGGDVYVDQNGDNYADGVLQQTFDPSLDPDHLEYFGYWFFDGTSMAAPHVAGVAALVIANGVSDPDIVRAVLESTAEDKGASGWDKSYGYGIVDAAAAVAAAGPPNEPPTVTITSPEDGAIFASGAEIDFVGTATDPEDMDITDDLVWTLSSSNVQIGTGGSFSTDLSDGVHTIIASVTDSGGESGSDSITITVGEPPPPEKDVVTITKAQYNSRKGELKVEATSSEPGGVAVLTVEGYDDGVMTYDSRKNKYKFQTKSVSGNPGSVTVTSDLGGSDTAQVNGR